MILRKLVSTMIIKLKSFINKFLVFLLRRRATSEANALCHPNSLTSASTLTLISSLISLTCSIGFSFGSSSVQSSVGMKLAGQTSSTPQPMVITRSALSIMSKVRATRGILAIDIERDIEMATVQLANI